MRKAWQVAALKPWCEKDLMTTAEAIKTYEALRRAVKALSPIDEGRARNALAQVHAVSDVYNYQMASAYGTLRSFFQQLDKWEAQHTSN
jgi:hypothetical protein